MGTAGRRDSRTLPLKKFAWETLKAGCPEASWTDRAGTHIRSVDPTPAHGHHFKREHPMLWPYNEKGEGSFGARKLPRTGFPALTVHGHHLGTSLKCRCQRAGRTRVPPFSQGVPGGRAQRNEVPGGAVRESGVCPVGGFPRNMPAMPAEQLGAVARASQTSPAATPEGPGFSERARNSH